MNPDIIFPHLGIKFDTVGRGIQLGDFTIAFYGIIIASAMIAGYLLACYQAKRTGQKAEIYLDTVIWAIIFAIIGARCYYVIFSWDYYKEHPAEIINLRGGGLAIYGGIIGGLLAAYIVSRVKKYSFLLLVDTACAGIALGQAIGRFGNFFNREAFGKYTDSLFAMQIKLSDVNIDELTGNLGDHLVNVNGTSYIQVHPTFLYESIWSLCLMTLILIFTKKKKYDGQLMLIYLCGYSLGRFWIESLRTDQLMLFGTGIPVSMALSGLICVSSGGLLIYNFIKRKIKKSKAE
ncbi:MAG: prolipoprotein diacylglyceryl transferase [Lachnospiraceae bacterium]|nr:prolipoprotein diacylglyceryl transferase [Lachnospiraceae bacterium]